MTLASPRNSIAISLRTHLDGVEPLLQVLEVARPVVAESAAAVAKAVDFGRRDGELRACWVAPVAAGRIPTPNDGRCVAANMANEHSAEQMAEAMMLHTGEHGDAGMFKAVAESSCDTD